MKDKVKRPGDIPAAACGRCIWWYNETEEGQGHCAVWDEKRYYKCMVCPEYEFDNEPGL